MPSENQKGEGTLKIIGGIVAVVLAVAGALIGAQGFVEKKIKDHAENTPSLSEKEIQSLIAAEVNKQLANVPQGDTATDGLYLSSIPSGAVVAFADAPTGSTKRNCAGLPGGWVDFAAADGRFILGAGRLNENTYRAGQDGGEATVTLTIAQMPKHQHETNVGVKPDNYGKGKHAPTLTGSLAGNVGDLSAPVGGDQPHNNMPPYIALTFCKKV